MSYEPIYPERTNEINHHTQIGTYRERTGKFHHLARLDHQTSTNNYIFKGVNAPFIFGYFELRWEQIDNIKYQFRKYEKEMKHKRPTLLAALIYAEGIPFSELKKLYSSLGHRFNFKLLFVCIQKFNLRMKPPVNYFINKVLNHTISGLDSKIKEFIKTMDFSCKPSVKVAIASYIVMNDNNYLITIAEICKISEISQSQMYRYLNANYYKRYRRIRAIQFVTK